MEEFVKIFNKVSISISVICTTFTNVFGQEWVLFAGYLILNILDYFTGVIKARIKKVESSNKGLIGIIKKISYWILILVSFLIAFLLMQIGQKININLDFIMLFGWFTLACLIINESRSILENLIEIGVKVPNFFKKGLEVYEKLINDITEKIDNK